jgi:RNA polymerase sigma-70 factor (ECF subfamily)
MPAVDELTRLAIRARDGDRAALDAFVRLSQADVWRFCAHLGGREHADDLTQTTFLRTWKALPRFRADASARTWLLAIARRTCADHVRSAVRWRRITARLSAPAEAVPDPGGLHEIQAAIDGLHPDRREAFVLTQVLGLAYHDAAEVLDCPIGTIRSRVARAREDLIAALDGGRELFGLG